MGFAGSGAGRGIPRSRVPPRSPGCRGGRWCRVEAAGVVKVELLEALRAGKRAARIRLSPPWDSRAETSRCRQATRNSSWVQDSARARSASRGTDSRRVGAFNARVRNATSAAVSRAGMVARVAGIHATPSSSATPRAVSQSAKHRTRRPAQAPRGLVAAGPCMAGRSSTSCVSASLSRPNPDERTEITESQPDPISAAIDISVTSARQKARHALTR
jgi:hypothetical protein